MLASIVQKPIIGWIGRVRLALPFSALLCAIPCLATEDINVTVQLQGKSHWHDNRISAMAEVQQRLFKQLEEYCGQLDRAADLTSLEPVNPLYMSTRYTPSDQKQYRINLPDATGLCIQQDLH